MRLRKHWQLRGRFGTVMVVRRQDLWPGEAPLQLDDLAEEFDKWLSHPAVRTGMGELYLHLAAHTTGTSTPDGNESPKAVTARLTRAFEAAGYVVLAAPDGPYWEPFIGGVGSGDLADLAGAAAALAGGAAPADDPSSSKAGSAGGAATPPGQQKTFVELLLVDQNRNPVPGRPFKIQLPDGSTRTGKLDENGFAQLADLDPGTCKVTFTDMDAKEWKKSS